MFVFKKWEKIQSLKNIDGYEELLFWKGSIDLQTRMDENWVELNEEDKIISEQLSNGDMIKK